MDLPETTPVGTEVVRLTATDPDSGQNGRVTYRLDDESPAAAEASGSRLFAVDAETGVVTTVAALDREAAAVHRLVVAAVDAGSRPRSSTAVVEIVVGDVDDEPPRFSLPVCSTCCFHFRFPRRALLTSGLLVPCRRESAGRDRGRRGRGARRRRRPVQRFPVPVGRRQRVSGV